LLKDHHMSIRVAFAGILAAGLSLAALVAAPDQQSHQSHQPAAAPTHKHYVETPDQPNAAGQIAPRLQNLGRYSFPVTTKSRRAQLFMNQGINLSWAFNHAESGRAFREAARLDPNLAMAYWGQALVLGPNINAAMEPTDEGPAYAAIQKAVSLKSKVTLTPKERALIDALAQRYTGKPEDRRARDEAYSAAMRKVQQKFPADIDVAVLFVESVMDLRPWGYWSGDGRPYEGIAEAVALTEKVIARRPDHPGALHLYIHLVEAVRPEKAEAAADKLLHLAPAAGHLVHMPAHIYQRVGRYADAIKSNQLAIAADEDYITQCRAQGLYPMGYYPHNLHFLWFAATADGQGALAIESARKTASKVDDETLKKMPLLAAFRVVPYYALTRFGKWQEMLKEPAPPADNPFLAGIYHYARGLAFVATGRLTEADQALATIRKMQGDKALETPLFSPNLASAIFAIAPEVLAGEIAAARRQYDTAIAHLARAVRLEDGLVYTEPSEWHYPPRHALGAVLLEAGRPAEAETVYWEDLRRNVENGWALYGVVQALRAQGKNDQAAIAQARLDKTWARADHTLTGSKAR
jgi:tetratricopeptide (TPR) repeat protein